ncbi:MAG: hypothetical protein JNL01_14365 [Bdellovibrionales bacterium]|nr:hypothetical protein [Bdellovibrionales bacterium]
MSIRFRSILVGSAFALLIATVTTLSVPRFKKTTFRGLASTTDISDRYWSYRERFLKKFLYVADVPGGSLPIDHIHQKNIKFGDTVSGLGTYLTVLGTELAVQRKAGVASDHTLLEIKFALRAFERLSEQANLHFAGKKEVNGFFFRDDADESYLNLRPGAFDSINSDYIDFRLVNWSGNVTSQDQLVELFMGYRFLHQALDRNIPVEKDLDDRIQSQLVSILKYVYGQKKDWVIRIPRTKDKVLRGPNMGAFSKGFFKIAKSILPAEKMKGIKPAFLSKVAFPLFQIIFLPGNWFVKSMIMELGAAGDVWGKNTQVALTEFHQAYDFPIWPLANAVLTGKKLITDPYETDGRTILTQEDFKHLIDVLPPQGPYMGDPNGWSSFHRFFVEKRQRTYPVKWKKGDYVIPDGTEFNGMDAMMLMNLYLIYFGGPDVATYKPSPGYLTELHAQTGWPVPGPSPSRTQ